MAATKKTAAKKAVAKKVLPASQTGLVATVPKVGDVVGVGRSQFVIHELTVAELERKIAIIDEAVIVIRKAAKTRLKGYAYGNKPSGRSNAIRKAATLEALQQRLATYGLKVGDYEVVSASFAVV